jgi:hypothetical protein
LFFLLSVLFGPAPHSRRAFFFSMENLIDHDAIKAKFIAASVEMAAHYHSAPRAHLS